MQHPALILMPLLMLMINFILKLFAALIVNCLLARGSVHLVFVIEIHLEKYIIGARNKKAFLLLAGNLRTNSHADFSLLTTPEKNKRYTNLRTRLKSTEREVKRLHDIIDLHNKKEGVTVNEDMHSDLENIMTEMSAKVGKKIPWIRLDGYFGSIS